MYRTTCSAVVLVAACGGDPKATETGETGGTDDSGSEPTALVEEDPVCASPQVDLSGADDDWVVVTEHYTLEISGFDEEETRNLGTLAETAWGGLAAFFGGELDGPLEVVIAEDLAGFEAALAEDGISGLEGAGGYYDPGGGRAYLYRQPTAYYSRVLMLHELVHQYQYQLDGADGLPSWYVEGLAEALGRHHWDGECVRLRARPLLSWEDMAAQAQAELDLGEPDLEAVFGGGSASRALSYALTRLLTSDPELAPAFASWRADVARGETSATDLGALEEALGPIDELTGALQDFVPEDQEPLSPVWLDWIPEGDDAALGWADASSAARVKGEVSRQDMRFAWPTGSVGSVYGYDEGPGDIELALLSADGSVSRFAYIGGAVSWDVLGYVSVDSEARWSQVADEDSTEIAVGEEAVTLPRTLSPAGGLALYADEARYSELHWE